MSRINGSSYDSRLMGRTSTGDGSTLSLDFTAMGGVLDPLITFSRADATARATFINSLGYVETVPALQPQAPRFTFSETSIGTPRGLLLEGLATNFVTQSQALTGLAAYGMLAISIDGTVTDPMNGLQTKKIAASFSAGSAFHGYLRNNTNAGAATTVTVSIFAKKNNYKYLFMYDGTTSTAAVRFNLDTGVPDLPVASGGAGYVSSKMTPAGPAGSGWYRCEMTATVPANGNRSWGFQPLPDSGVTFAVTGSNFVGTGNANDGIYVIGFQVEANANASSYILTSGSTVTRAVDTAIIAAGTNFSSWYTGGTTGTFVTEWCRCTATTTQRTVIATSDVSNQHLHQYIAATTSRLRLADKVPAFIETANASLDNSINKGAFSYAGSVQSLCLNGGTVVPGTLTFTTAPTWLSIGGPSTNGTSITDTAVVLNNAIRKIKYFPTRLTDGQIQGLTA